MQTKKYGNVTSLSVVGRSGRMKVPDYRNLKLAGIRRSIKEGRYNVSAASVADAMIARLLFGEPQQGPQKTK